jgi:hypothetical protein
LFLTSVEQLGPKTSLMYYTLPKIIASIAMLVCFTYTKVGAQESVTKIHTELSFELSNRFFDAHYFDVCTAALINFDNIQKLNIEVTLYSAKSLNVSSGRYIQDSCIDHGDVYSDVEFRLILQDGVYSIAPIFINEKEIVCP